MELAFGNRALTEEAGNHAVASEHLLGEREADRDRQAARDDGVAAVEAL